MAVLPGSKGEDMSNDNLDTSGERGRGGHTPGPWECSPQNNNPFCAWDVKAPNEVNGYICTTSGNAKANAKLIAAAPELVKELDHAIDVLDPAMSRQDIVCLRERLIRFMHEKGLKT